MHSATSLGSVECTTKGWVELSMAEFNSLSEAAVAWLKAAVSSIEEFHAEHGGEHLGGVNVKFTWRGDEYEVGVRRLGTGPEQS